MIGTYHEYKAHTQLFIEWIQQAGKAITKRKIPNSLQALKIAVKSIIECSKESFQLLTQPKKTSHSKNSMKPTEWTNISKVLNSGAKAIELRTLVGNFYSAKQLQHHPPSTTAKEEPYSKKKRKNKKKGTINSTTENINTVLERKEEKENELHRICIEILKDCYENLKTWYQKENKNSSEIPPLKLSSESVPLVKSETIFHVLQDDPTDEKENADLDHHEDPTTADQSADSITFVPQENEEKLSIEDIDILFGELRLLLLCFVLDLLKASEHVTRVWREVKEEKTTLIGATMVTYAAMKEIRSLFANIQLAYPNSSKSAFDFQTILKQTLQPLEYEAIMKLPFMIEFNETINLWNIYEKCFQQVIPIKDRDYIYGPFRSTITGEPWAEVRGPIRVEEPKDKAYDLRKSFFMQELRILFHDCIDYYHAHGEEELLHRSDSYPILAIFCKEIDNFFIRGVNTIPLSFIGWCWMKSVESLADKNNLFMAKTIYLSRLWRRQMYHHYHQAGEEKNCIRFDYHGSDGSAFYGRLVDKIPFYKNYAIEYHNPYLAGALCISQLAQDAQFCCSSNLHEKCDFYHRISFLYIALRQNNFLPQIPILDQFISIYRDEIFPSGEMPMKGFYHTRYSIAMDQASEIGEASHRNFLQNNRKKEALLKPGPGRKKRVLQFEDRSIIFQMAREDDFTSIFEEIESVHANPPVPDGEKDSTENHRGRHKPIKPAKAATTTSATNSLHAALNGVDFDEFLKMIQTVAEEEISSYPVFSFDYLRLFLFFAKIHKEFDKIVSVEYLSEISIFATRLRRLSEKREDIGAYELIAGFTLDFLDYPVYFPETYHFLTLVANCYLNSCPEMISQGFQLKTPSDDIFVRLPSPESAANVGNPQEEHEETLKEDHEKEGAQENGEEKDIEADKNFQRPNEKDDLVSRDENEVENKDEITNVEKEEEFYDDDSENYSDISEVELSEENRGVRRAMAYRKWMKSFFIIPQKPLIAYRVHFGLNYRNTVIFTEPTFSHVEKTLTYLIEICSTFREEINTATERPASLYDELREGIRLDIIDNPMLGFSYYEKDCLFNFAIRSGKMQDLELAEWIVAACGLPMNLQRPQEKFRNPLQIAICDKNKAAIDLIFAANKFDTLFDCINEEDGNTALHYAAMLNNSNVIHYLMIHNASETILNKQGKTPLHYIRDEKTKTMMTRLIKHRKEVLDQYKKNAANGSQIRQGWKVEEEQRKQSASETLMNEVMGNFKNVAVSNNNDKKIDNNNNSQSTKNKKTGKKK